MKNFIVKKCFEFLFFIYRRRSWPSKVFRGGLLLIVTAVTGGATWIIELLMGFMKSTETGQEQFSGWVASMPALCFVLGAVLVSVGLYAGFIDWRNNKVVGYGIVIELRGLRVAGVSHVEDADVLSHVHSKHSVLIDCRSCLNDGNLTNPQKALEIVSAILPHQLLSSLAGKKSKDIKLVFGSLAAVPLTFLAGVLIDDESDVTRVDWDRSSGRWRGLTEPDDGARFDCRTIQTGDESGVLVLCVSVSYPVNMIGIVSRAGNAKVMELVLPTHGFDTHWSEEKQTALAKQFIDVLIEHSNFKRIHLHLAGPSSLVFLFGQRYDRRNLPPINVYQFERGQAQEYPWSIRMPVAGKTDASLDRYDEVYECEVPTVESAV